MFITTYYDGATEINHLYTLGNTRSELTRWLVIDDPPRRIKARRGPCGFSLRLVAARYSLARIGRFWRLLTAPVIGAVLVMGLPYIGIWPVFAAFDQRCDRQRSRNTGARMMFRESTKSGKFVQRIGVQAGQTEAGIVHYELKGIEVCVITRLCMTSR